MSFHRPVRGGTSIGSVALDHRPVQSRSTAGGGGETFFLLKEDADRILKEDGDRILKEDAP